MQYFILGLAALVLALVALERFARANRPAMSGQVRQALGVLALAAALAFFARNALLAGTALAVLGAWLLDWAKHVFGQGNSPPPSSGPTSNITTDSLEVALDHATGAMTGRVLKGLFQGRTIESLKPVEIALLWRDCQFNDPQSAQILEAYLDRAHPTWREDMARGEREMHGGPDGRMTQAEAYEILGLGPGASEDAIRRAHRELILKFHPDRGGSTYLASKINEAKDVLLAE